MKIHPTHRCERCGLEIELPLPNQTAKHAACPKRGPRQQAPSYRLIKENA